MWDEMKDQIRKLRKKGNLAQSQARYEFATPPAPMSSFDAEHNGPPPGFNRAMVEARERQRVEAELHIQRERQQLEHARWRARDQEQRDLARFADKECIRNLREHIRERNRLDIEIWSHKNERPSRQGEVMEMCRRADELFGWICTTVSKWEQSHFDSEMQGEWNMANLIKQRMKEIQRETVPWTQKPPWMHKPKNTRSQAYTDAQMHLSDEVSTLASS